MQNLTGHRFGRLLVLSESGRDKHKQILWKCLCDCGAEKTVTGSNLRGKTRSCGCLKAEIDPARLRTHGKSGTKEHKIWKGMISRCAITTATGYKNYGGRGVKVCERWHDFSAFFTDMGECGQGMSIDRIDVNGNYEPGNCCWSTKKDQARNTRRSTRITHNGETLTIVEWSERVSIGESTIRRRLKLGWPVMDALEVRPVAGQKVRHSYLLKGSINPA